MNATIGQVLADVDARLVSFFPESGVVAIPEHVGSDQQEAYRRTVGDAKTLGLVTLPRGDHRYVLTDRGQQWLRGSGGMS